jgi:hypothetical protein
VVVEPPLPVVTGVPVVVVPVVVAVPVVVVPSEPVVVTVPLVTVLPSVPEVIALPLALDVTVPSPPVVLAPVVPESSLVWVLLLVLLQATNASPLKSGTTEAAKILVLMFNLGVFIGRLWVLGILRSTGAETGPPKGSNFKSKNARAVQRRARATRTRTTLLRPCDAVSGNRRMNASVRWASPGDRFPYLRVVIVNNMKNRPAIVNITAPL